MLFLNKYISTLLFIMGVNNDIFENLDSTIPGVDTEQPSLQPGGNGSIVLPDGPEIIKTYGETITERMTCKSSYNSIIIQTLTTADGKILPNDFSLDFTVSYANINIFDNANNKDLMYNNYSYTLSNPKITISYNLTIKDIHGNYNSSKNNILRSTFAIIF